jgi:hypothetical protein
MKKSIFKILFLLSLSFSFLPAFASITTIDNFNTYTNGDLNGQGDWVGSNKFDVQDSIFYEGSKGISVAIGDYPVIIKNITTQIDGIFSIYGYGINEDSFKLDYNGDLIIGIAQIGGGLTYLFGGEVSVEVGTANADAWNKYEIEIDADLSQVRGRLNSGDWTEWQILVFTAVNQIHLEGGGGDIGYFDYINYESVNGNGGNGGGEIGTVFSVPSASSSDITASIGSLLVDSWVILVLVIGLPLAFYIIQRTIKIVPTKVSKKK